MIYDDISVEEKKNKTEYAMKTPHHSPPSFQFISSQPVFKCVHGKENPSFILAICHYYSIRFICQRSSV